ncbi:uncharacterized protein LOC110985190 [Acanthaster planci]|uniref:Uncharacterized protein LOC110985190 n=1 Tax=Acanthaster planci TaxID=133434 RepID=A0A8B7Z9T4_ACAPL|nr:uncharacterized protein LOC110985190 [Acanthaster planci]
MFNFAAAFSERIRYSRSTKVVRFVPDDDGGSSPEPAHGGGGEIPRCRDGNSPASLDDDYGLTSARWIQSRGDTGVRSTITGQTSGQAPLQVSQGRVSGDSAQDQQNPNKPQEGLPLKSLLPHKKFWRYRRTKVRPMVASVSRSAQRPHLAAEDSGDGMLLTSLAAPSSSERSQQIIALKSCQATTDIDLRSSGSPLAAKDNLSPTIKRRPDLPSNSKSQLSWTTRLRNLFTSRKHRSATAVVPFQAAGASAEWRPDELMNKPSAPEPKSDKSVALKTKIDERRFEADGVSRVPHHWQTSANVTTRATLLDTAPMPLPGVPQFDGECQHSSPPAPRICSTSPRESPSSSEHSVSSKPSILRPASRLSCQQGAVMTSGDRASKGGDSIFSPPSPPTRDDPLSSPSLPSLRQSREAASEEGDGALGDRRSISKQPHPPSPKSKVTPSSQGSLSSIQKKQEAVEQGGNGTPTTRGGLISKPALVKSKRTPGFQEQKGVHVRKLEKHYYQTMWANTEQSLSQPPPVQNMTPNVTNGVKMRERALKRVEQVALKIDVSFIYANLEAAKVTSPQCRWVDVLQRIIQRSQELRQMRLEKKQVPYTSEEIRGIELNAYRAREKLYLLKQMITAASFVQAQPGEERRRFFHHICNTPPDLKRSQATLSEKTTTQTSNEPSRAPRKCAPGQNQAILAIISKETASKNPKSRILERKGPATEIAPSREQGTESLQISPLQIFKRMTHKKLRRCIKEKTIKAQTSDSNSRPASPLTTPKSCSSEQKKSLPPTMLRKSSPGASSQIPRKTSSPNNTPSGLSTRKSPSKTMSVASISPSKTTHPKIAPSCLKKILPGHLQGPYPTVDSGDLEYVMTSSGSKVVLGRGDNGEVLLMRRHGDGTLLAVKKLSNNRFRITVDKHMLREVAAMQAVSSCPFFPKLFGVVDNSSFAQEFLGDESTNLAMDFAAARFSHGLLTAREWLNVCRDVTEGLKVLHRTGWVHNDLHVGNAMLCKSPPGSKIGWTAKIIDLGLAHPLQNLPPAYNLTHEEKQCYYQMCKQVAPEIVEGKTQFSTKSDIYSLGKLFKDIAYNSSSLHGLRHLGLACMIRNPAHRPTLNTVLKKLDGLCSKVAKSKLPPLPPP